MFGHDNGDNNDDNTNDNGGGQISLPPVNNDDVQAPEHDAEAVVSEHVDADASNDLIAPNHRAITKSGAPTDDLLDIKQDALQALTPLVDHLDQTPEERFRTTMMMIQASDNHSLVKAAYEAAQKITNEKERAQALLDIVNEINYFTQHNQA
jgi:hypothetical protein